MLVGRPDEQVAGHPQVDRQRGIVFELDQQVLAASRDRAHRCSFDRALDRSGVDRAGPPLVEHLESLDPPANQLRLELTSDRLYFGKFRHLRKGPSINWPTRSLSGSCLCLRPRVRLEVSLLQIFAGEMRVQLRSREVRVSKHLLDRAQVAPAREQVGGK